ncbi:MAG: hypothetical protein ACKVT0_16580 [Planctomycetaceae bacterium]
MHILGRVLWFLAIAGFIAVMMLASRQFIIKNSYMKKVLDQKEQIAKDAEQLAALENQVQDLRSNLARVMLGWDRYWDAIDTNVNPADGSLTAAIGTNLGLFAPADQNLPLPVIYAFQPAANGEYVYVGSFAAATIRENNSALVPTFRVRPTDVSTWQPGKWRYRSMIPAGYTERFADLSERFTVSDELKTAKLENVEAQTKLKDVAQGHLELRLGELHGNPALAGTDDKLPPETAKGYIATIADVEEKRNEAQEEVDRLRRRLKAAHDRMQQLIQENQELTNQLPGSTTLLPQGKAQAVKDN